MHSIYYLDVLYMLQVLWDCKGINYNLFVFSLHFFIVFSNYCNLNFIYDYGIENLFFDSC